MSHIRASSYIALCCLVLGPLPLAAQAASISPRGLALIRLCDSLSLVAAAFPTARDTVATGELDSQWRAKVVHLTDGSQILFESSWIDSTHVWRISTNSPAYRTPRGHRVGDLVAAALAHGEQPRFEYPEGLLVLTFGDSVWFQVDSASTTSFFRHPDYERRPTRALDVHARIAALFVNGDCRGFR